MRIALIADTFPPLRNSGAVQLRDLSIEFIRQGHTVTMLVPAPDLATPWAIEDYHGVEVVRLRAPRHRHSNNLRRALGEFATPWWMLRNFRASPAHARKIDRIVWYSPTIFLGPIVRALKRRHRAPSYLIVRDIFPEWMADMGLMRRGLAYKLLKVVANFQYSLADTIGVQTPGNLAYFADRIHRGQNVEVLQNWLTESPARSCSIQLGVTPLADRKIFIYAGNMGVAQGMTKLIDLAARLNDDPRIGFVFVGRGSDAATLQVEAARRGLTNTIFFDEIDPDEIPGLYAQCHVGLVALDARHRTHNIPGKFISYMHAGLPVLASINPGNDMAGLVAAEKVGRVSTDPAGADLGVLALAMLDEELAGSDAPARCRGLARRLFSSEAAVHQIAAALAR